jgi:lipopolysaccharide cholinephosphotransferase
MRLHNETNYDIRILQQKIIGNLEAIDQVCREHGLRYYLWAGTMLGAVRHKGFIPWDDDMDICMPRPDYEQLISHWREWLPQPYEVIATETDPTYPYPFAKIEDASTTVLERPDFKFLEGVYIDVFPIDGVPSDEQKRKKHFKHYKFWRHLLFLRGRDPFKHGHGPRSWLPWLLHKTFSLAWLQRKVRSYMVKYDYEQSAYVCDYDDGLRGCIEKRVLGTPQLYPFEDKQFMGVEHYDEYLSNKYGDYMQLPPVEKQIQHHFFRLDLNRPYKETTIEEMI